MIKHIIKEITPPIILKIIKKILTINKGKYAVKRANKYVNKQELDLYWTQDMANQLENWGKDHTWNEIECLLVNCKGKVLDIACGTGVNIHQMARFSYLDIYGFDISDFLIQKATQKGIDQAKLKVENAISTTYKDNEFDFSYSIGSLEHFTEEGIDLFLKECSRYTSKASFHMIPVSESNINEGWLRTNQSFFNNSIEWWLEKFKKHFREVYIINSGYKDKGISIGKWFICKK